MNNITVSLETAKKLKEAGWERPTHIGTSLTRPSINNIFFTEARELGDILFLPTAEEVLRELPENIGGLYLLFGKTKDYYFCHYHAPFSHIKHPQRASTLADAAAEMWIYLKENNLL